ncbi:zinicin-like metallopeptidase [Antarctobacter heliothermus]|uniref:Zinicin-like metallopeptidase n=1 Tax=Antarctobacter heliothermus TaxID=74033 RepID=A0A222E0T8_9RHOB|nr:metallopeptidase family protein [Antarctobacter heliothermus]ASP19824.1 zinicin-like metallopeptidase [Antarctobacter heliothermus]MBT55389.1 neutral zinc metallopeptidase [Mameliella sp.]|tara:strand:+ start:625 stop:1008 length:384 start_codon:yes stop_codon:yes gene_type:complete
MTDVARFHDVAQRTVAGFPEPFRAGAQNVLLRVVDWPPRDILNDMQIRNPLELTGMYDGVPMTHKSFADPAPFPDTVWLFREPILNEWRDRGDIELDDLIAHVTVHEFAHHFGWSDDDIAAIDRWWE